MFVYLFSHDFTDIRKSPFLSRLEFSDVAEKKEAEVWSHMMMWSNDLLSLVE